MNAYPNVNKRDIAHLCLSCAKSIYLSNPPTERYAESAGRLLFGTACAESLLYHRRQIGYAMDDLAGAWSLWQIECASVLDAVRMLSRHANLGVRCIEWLESHDVQHAWNTMNGDPLVLMQSLLQCDAMACLFARLHYLRFPSPIPWLLEEQAAYWKRLYNTSFGSGTVPGYLEKWRHVGAETWEALVESQ